MPASNDILEMVKRACIDMSATVLPVFLSLFGYLNLNVRDIIDIEG